MVNKKLEDDEIRAIVVQNLMREERKVPWSMQEDVKSHIYAAFQDHKTTLTIRGEKFTVSYHREGRAYIRPIVGFAPCGWFTLSVWLKEYERSTR